MANDRALSKPLGGIAVFAIAASMVGALASSCQSSSVSVEEQSSELTAALSTAIKRCERLFPRGRRRNECIAEAERSCRGAGGSGAGGHAGGPPADTRGAAADTPARGRRARRGRRRPRAARSTPARPTSPAAAHAAPTLRSTSGPPRRRPNTYGASRPSARTMFGSTPRHRFNTGTAPAGRCF